MLGWHGLNVTHPPVLVSAEMLQASGRSTDSTTSSTSVPKLHFSQIN
jgi:hypothetical protein